MRDALQTFHNENKWVTIKDTTGMKHTGLIRSVDKDTVTIKPQRWSSKVTIALFYIVRIQHAEL